MAESIKNELELLERMGRVTAQDHRPVHADFGFNTAQADPAGDAIALVGGTNLTTDLDDAWSRLKRTINPE